MRCIRTKIEILERRYPGLDDKLERMFDEAWPSRDVVHMLASHYGERLSTATVERYKRKHWQAQRELVEEMSENIGSSGDRAIEPSEIDDFRLSIADLKPVENPISASAHCRVRAIEPSEIDDFRLPIDDLQPVENPISASAHCRARAIEPSEIDDFRLSIADLKPELPQCAIVQRGARPMCPLERSASI